MSNPKMIIHYVESVPKSVAFYADVLGKPAAESSPNFAMFPLESGMMFGLWARGEVAPTAAVTGGGSEIAFMVPDKDAVMATYADWSARNVTVAQTPTNMDFGFTFTALDPDGHRLRVFAPAPM